MKHKARKKLIQNKQSIFRAGSGPNKIKALTQLEEIVCDIFEFKQILNPPGNEFGVVVQNNDVNVPKETEDIFIENHDVACVFNEIENLNKSDKRKDCSIDERPKKRIKNDQRNDTKLFLEKQISVQENFNTILNKKLEEIITFKKKKLYYEQKDAIKIAKQLL